MKTINYKTLQLSLCTIISIICMYIVSTIAKSSGNILSFGSFTIPVLSLQGVITAFNSLFCILKDHKCDFIQGFVWGKPLPFDTAVELCKGIC